MLKIENLQAYYGKCEVIKGISLSVEPGEFVTILGANGAGKTSLLSAICGLVKKEGSITFCNQRIDDRSTTDIAKLGLAYVPENRGTFLGLNVEENLQLGGISRKDKAEVKKDINLLYDHFPVLAEKKKQQAGLLSGGEQQMLAIARAIMLRPKLLLIDEPSLGLAPVMTKHVYNILMTLKKEYLISVLLVEQNSKLALEITNRIYLLVNGSIVLEGPREKINETMVFKNYFDVESSTSSRF